MNGLRDFVVCARDGLCGGARRRAGHEVGGGGGTLTEDDDFWDAWPGEEPATLPPVPKVIHVATMDDAGDDFLLGLDFVDSSATLPNDLLLREQPPVGCYSFQRSWGGLNDNDKKGRRSSASSLSASTDTEHAQIFHAWTPPTPNLITTMAYVFPQRQTCLRDPEATVAVAVSDVDGSSYSSRDCGRYWLARSMPQSFLPHPKPRPPPPRTEASSVASC